MIIKKISAAISIFVLLFSGAWILNQQEKREFYIPVDNEEVVEITPVDFELEAEGVEKWKVFESREYVRIQATS